MNNESPKTPFSCLSFLLEKIRELKPNNHSQEVTLEAVVAMINKTAYFDGYKTLLDYEKEQLELASGTLTVEGDAASILKELVRLKDLKEELDLVEQSNQDQEFVLKHGKYVTAKGFAWKAAREYLSSPLPPIAEEKVSGSGYIDTQG